MRPLPVRLLAVPFLALCVTLGACGDDPVGPRFPEDVEFAASLGVDLDQMTELESGVYVQTLTPGEGAQAQDGSLVFVDYILWLPDGTEVDSGEDVELRLSSGPNGVIDGFRLGMIGAQQGETRLIVIPSPLGYGPQGRDQIPPNSVLVFRVDLDVLDPPI